MIASKLQTTNAPRARTARPATFMAALAAGLTLVGCGGGGGGGGGSNPLSAPQGVVAFAGDGEVTLTWTPNAKAETYNIYWSTTPGVTKDTGTPILGVNAPFQHTGLSNLQEHYYVVTAAKLTGKEGKASNQASAIPRVTAGQFDPTWGSVVPTQTITINFDPMQTPEANGLLLAAQIAALVPGDRLEIGAGTWSMPNFFSIDLVGTAMAPIWIAAAPNARPVLTRADLNDAVVHVGAAGGARFLALIGLEIGDGGRGFDLWDAQEVWINLALLNRTGDTPIAADNGNTANLYLTRNQINHAGGDGHGIVLGTSDMVATTTGTVIAQNQISDCRGIDATGIWVREGSNDNWIVENVVHDTDWPCILVGGAGAGPWNLIERNVCYTSDDNVMEVQSDAWVRNNLIMDGDQGFSSHDDFGVVGNLEVVHNTIINNRRGANLDNWASKPGMVFANNVVYSNNSDSVRFPLGAAGVIFVGNVTLGPVKGIASGFVQGRGLKDFADASWNAAKRDVMPVATSPIIDGAVVGQHLSDDLTGTPRDATTLESGCLDVL